MTQDHLLATPYIRRLQTLRTGMEHALKRFEFFRPDPGGHQVTPEPESHRPYYPGDDPRYMDWSLYARFDRLYLKNVVTEKEGVLGLLVDVSRSMAEPFPDKMKRALEVAGALAYLSLAAGNRVSVYGWAERVLGTWTFDRGEADAIPALKSISNLPQGTLTILEGTLEHILAKRENGPSRMVIISDLLDRSRYQPLLKKLRDSGSPIAAVQVLHHEEEEPSIRGKVIMTDPETGASRRQLVGFRARKEIRSRVGKFLEKTRTSFSDMGIPLVRCRADDPFEEPVRRLIGFPGWSARR